MFVIKALVLSVVILNESFAKPQFGIFDQFSTYQNNPFLNSQQRFSQNYYQDNDFHNQNQRSSNYETSSSSSCDSYWSYQNSFGTKSGLITIPDPYRPKSVIEIKLSLAARLSTVNEQNGNICLHQTKKLKNPRR